MKDCMEWIKNSKYSDLLRVKNFNLRKNAQAVFLTTERKRAVYKWTQGWGSYPRLEVERYPTPVVVIIGSGNRFSPVDLPTPLASTVAHEKAKAERHAARVAELRAKRAEKALLEPKEAKGKRKAKGEGRTSKKKPKAEPVDQSNYGIQLSTAVSTS